jgi:DNA-binding SARP family transcriptional activator/TolB-like protein
MIRVEALGGLRILVNGEESVPLAKQRLKSALLVYLAVERSCMREALIGTFWPEREPERARHVLSQTVYELRKSLGEEWLTIAGDRIAVSDRVSSDVVEFTEAVEKGAYEEALRLYHGGFLDGTYLAESHDFEEWCDRRNQRLTKLLRRALKETCELAEVPAWIEVAIEVARKSAERDPTDDEIQHSLLQLLVRAGRRTDALRQYEKYEAALAADELEPLDHTRALIATIRDATESVEPVVVTPFAGGNGTTVSAPRPVTAVPARSAAAERAAARHRRSAIAGGAVVVALAVVLPFLIGDPGNGEATKAADEGVPRIAVLPFKYNSAPGDDIGYFAAAITEGLNDALGRVRGLEVRTREAVEYYSRAGISPDSFAKALNVNMKVGGSVSKSGHNVSVHYQLSDAKTDRVLQSSGLTGNVGDFLQVRDSIVAELAVLLRRELGEQFDIRGRRAETTSKEGLELYQRAQQIHDDFVALLQTNGVDAAERALNRADSLVALASKKDPKWVAPVVLRGKIAGQHAHIAVLRRDPATPAEMKQAMQKAARYADAAIRLDGNAAGGYELRGMMKYRQVFARLVSDTAELKKLRKEAEGDLRRAADLDPTRAEAWSTLADLFIDQSRFSEAYRAAQKAYQADSYFGGANDIFYRLALSAFEVGDEAEATRWCNEGRKRYPRHQQFVYCALMLMAWGNTPEADIDSAWRLVRQTGTMITPPPGVDYVAQFTMMTAGVIARAGLPDSARHVMAQIKAPVASNPALLYLEAANRSRLGEYGQADTLLLRYLSAIKLNHSFVLDSRAFAPLREAHLNKARDPTRR